MRQINKVGGSISDVPLLETYQLQNNQQQKKKEVHSLLTSNFSIRFLHRPSITARSPNFPQMAHKGQSSRPHPQLTQRIIPPITSSILYNFLGFVISVVGFRCLVSSRLSQVEKSHLRVLDPSKEYDHGVDNEKIVLCTVVGGFSVLMAHCWAMFCATKWLQKPVVFKPIKNYYYGVSSIRKSVKISISVLTFTFSTLIFFWAARIGVRASTYHKLLSGGPRRVTAGTISGVIDFVLINMHFGFEDKKEVEQFMFVDPRTIYMIIAHSLTCIFIGRLVNYPRPFYHLHQVLLNLSCQLAAINFGMDGWKSHVVFAICLIIIILKELTETPLFGGVRV